MPELPEVETVRTTLEQLIVGKEILQVEVRLPRLIRQPEMEVFTAALAGLRIDRVGRRGKYLLLDAPPLTLVIHLRMEGKLSLHAQGEKEDKHVHVIFRFTDGTELRYRDVRQFGTMDLISQGEWEKVPSLLRLGPEPLSEEFTLACFRQKLLRRPRSRIKAALLNQEVVAGLGNIYTDEALFESSIHPERYVDSLKPKEVARLYEAIRHCLAQGVAAGGASVRTYRNSLGAMGYFQLQINVYGKKGEDCPRCGCSIERIVVGGRGTHLCPRCQRPPRTR